MEKQTTWHSKKKYGMAKQISRAYGTTTHQNVLLWFNDKQETCTEFFNIVFMIFGVSKKKRKKNNTLFSSDVIIYLRSKSHPFFQLVSYFWRGRFHLGNFFGKWHSHSVRAQRRINKKYYNICCDFRTNRNRVCVCAKTERKEYKYESIALSHELHACKQENFLKYI